MGFPEVGDAVSEHLVGSIGIAAGTVYGVDDLEGRLVAMCLPEACYGSTEYGA